MIEAVATTLKLAADVAMIVSITAGVCRWLKWSPINITVNIMTSEEAGE